MLNNLMTHPASIFPISALAVSAILLLSSCSSNSSGVVIVPKRSIDRLVTKSALALIAEAVADTHQFSQFTVQRAVH